MIFKKLIWSARAITELENLLEYLTNEWGGKIASRVVGDVNRNIGRIENTPEQFPVTDESRGIRRSVVSPQTSILFILKETEIEILSIFDNRQDPQKI